MFTELLNLTDALKVVRCPRCHTTGLEAIGYETFDAALASDRHQTTCTIDPSVAARCPMCAFVTEWPACLAG